MYEKIIVGIDDSDQGDDALVLAQVLAEPGACEVVGLFVHPAARTSTPQVAGDVQQRVVARTRKVLRETSADMPGGADVRFETAADLMPARALTDCAEAEGADLIVVGSTHHGPVGSLTSLTTAQRLLERAPCAVAVAPNGYRNEPELELRPVGVAYDGSREAELALTAGADLARECSSELQVIAVFSPAAPVVPPALGAGATAAASNLVHMRDAFREMVEKMTLRLSVPAQVVVLEGDPARELIAASRTLGVLLMSARSCGPLRRVLLGAVSASVTSKASCPVIVVPRVAHQIDEDRSSRRAAAWVAGMVAAQARTAQALDR